MATMVAPTSTFQAAVNEFREEAGNHKATAGSRSRRQAGLDAAPKIDVSGAIGVARGYRAR